MYFLSHSLAKRAIDNLVLLDTILVAKLGAHDDGLKVLTVADYFDVFAGKIVLNVSLYRIGSKHIIGGRFELGGQLISARDDHEGRE